MKGTCTSFRRIAFQSQDAKNGWDLMPSLEFILVTLSHTPASSEPIRLAVMATTCSYLEGSLSNNRRMRERASIDTPRMRGEIMLFMMLFRVCYVPGNVCTYVVRVSLERMVSSQALAHEDSHSPPVDGLRVGSPQQHLRLDVNRVPSLYRHVLLRSAVAVAAQLANRLILVQLDVVVARETKVC